MPPTFTLPRLGRGIFFCGGEKDARIKPAQGEGGEECCGSVGWAVGGEDFAFMLEERPGAYILVGNGDTAMVHHPEYDFDDNAIPAGCSWWAEIVENRMPA